MKVKPAAWKTGALWKASNKRGDLEAVIVGPSKAGEKIVRMKYVTGYGAARPGHEVEGSYSHRHMLKYFKPADESLIVQEAPRE